MKRYLLSIVLAALAVPMTGWGDVLLPGIASYDPPSFLRGGELRTPTRINGFVRNYTDPKNQLRSMDVWILGVGIESIEGGKRVFKKLSDEDIKKLLAKPKRTGPRPSKVGKVEEFQFSGHKAFKFDMEVPMPEIHEGTVLYHELIWVRLRPHLILALLLMGDSPEALASVRDSLSTFKIAAHPKFPEIVQDTLPVMKGVPRLGAVRSKELGEPIVSGPCDNLYYTGKYFVSIFYQMPKIETITYLKVSDSRKYAAAIRADYTANISLLQLLAEGEGIYKNRLSEKEKAELIQPLTPKQIREILAIHSQDANGKPLSWTEQGENHWQRSDQATARFNPNPGTLSISKKRH